MDIRELLRRFQKNQSNRCIARELGINRKTVSRYRKWAKTQGLLAKELGELCDLDQTLKESLGVAMPPQNQSSVERYRPVVVQLRKEGVEIAAIYERLKERGYPGTYSSVYRFVRRMEPKGPEVTVRVETKPGEEAQVDFGYAGKMYRADSGKESKAWAFVMVLSWSRHQYVEFVFDQRVETWLRLHRNAFEFFQGVPERIVPDNLKSAIVRACWHEPVAQLAYRECAEHYGFLISACRPRKPEHKGKVEQGGVHYVKRNFLGGRRPTTLSQANRDVLGWVKGTAGMRVHGTTKERPLDRFAIEQGKLQGLPDSPYDLAVWKKLKVLRDCYVHFDKSYYSAPFRLVGQQVLVRGGCTSVHIYTGDHQLVASHERATRPGRRKTHLDHLPAHKVCGLTLSRKGCRERAAEIGPSTFEVVERLLNHRPEDRLRTAGRLLGLARRFGKRRLEAACRRAVTFDEFSYVSIKAILAEGLDMETCRVPSSPPRAVAYVRSPKDLFEHLRGGGPWK